MIRILILLLFIASPLQAQCDQQYLEFSEGSYAELPFKYPSILDEASIREIVQQVSRLTDDEISNIQYLPIVGLPNSMNEIQVMLCEKGSRATRTCEGGLLYIFRRTDGDWSYPGEGVGRWVH